MMTQIGRVRQPYKETHLTPIPVPIILCMTKHEMGALLMELREALDHIAEIRHRLTESELFYGYRALPIAASGLFALAGAQAQPLVVPEPTLEVETYVLFWSAIAALSVACAAVWVGFRDYWAGPSQTRALTWIAVRQFVPCLFSGAVVAVAIVRLAPHAAWLLPGLWQLFFAQGIFASGRILPRSIYLAGAFYFCLGSINVLIGHDRPLSPWAMAVPFGLGQLLVAAILYWTLERRHGES